MAVFAGCADMAGVSYDEGFVVMMYLKHGFNLKHK